MKSAVVVTLLLASALASPTTAAAAERARLRVHLSGFRSAEGQVLIAVYGGEDGFPGDPGRAWKTLVTTIADGRASVTLRDLPPGEYAVAVVHDENSNNALDTSWVGIPREGVGTSNNAKGRMGPPKYRDAKFMVTAAGAVQDIEIVYF